MWAPPAAVPALTFQPVRVATTEEENGLLAFAGGRLVGVLVRLSGQHEGMAGHWFLEAGFGPGLDDVVQPAAFPDLAGLQNWMLARLRRRTMPDWPREGAWGSCST